MFERYLHLQSGCFLLNHLAPCNLDYKAHIRPMTSVCDVCSLRPSWPSHEVADLPHTALLGLLQQESSITDARSKRLGYHIDKMYSRMYRFNQQLGQVC